MKALSLYRLKNAEFYQFFKQFSEFMLANDLEALNLTNEFAEFSVNMNLFETIYNRTRGSEVTDVLKEMDKERDAVLTSVSIILSGHLKNYGEAYNTAANLLYNEVRLPEKKITFIKSKNYQIKTAKIKALLNDWEQTAQYTEAVNLLGLRDNIERLVILNADFEAFFEQRTKEYSSIKALPVVELRNTIRDDFYAIRDVLQVYFRKEESDVTLMNDINALIDSYNTTVAIRAGKAKVSDDEII